MSCKQLGGFDEPLWSDCDTFANCRVTFHSVTGCLTAPVYRTVIMVDAWWHVLLILCPGNFMSRARCW